MTAPRPLVTVVTPFYNTERYLAEAIESVLSQTYDHWEYLLVNNRSTDGSLAIAERYAAREPRIRVFTNETLLPQDANYSEALRHAGPGSVYCKIVQADDSIFPRCLEELVAIAEANPRVGIVSSYWLKGTTVLGSGIPLGTTVLSGRETCRRQILQSRFFIGSATVPLLRTAMVRETHPYYDPQVYHADTEACYRDLQRWDFGFVHQVLSFLRTDNAGRMAQVQHFFPHLLDKFIVVTKFGRAYLDAAEFRTAYADIAERYFRALGDALLTRRDPAFWSYHRQGLATIGYDLRSHKLWRYALRALVDAGANPKKTLGRLWRAARPGRAR